MRPLTTYLLTFLVFTAGAYEIQAQPVTDLSGAFRNDAKQEVHPELSIRDFRYVPANAFGSGILEPVQNKPGWAFLSSAILPGSAQAANGKWIRAGAYFLTEVAAIYLRVDRQRTAERQERAYIRYANSNWSVVTYAQWLVDYSQANNLNNGYTELQANISGQTASYSTEDWNKVNLDILRQVESLTPYITSSGSGSIFSHNLPNYGSQQYYELISKYYQFQAGWSDFNPGSYIYSWDGSDVSNLFLMGVRKADQFNDNYRLAGNILNLILINHMVSALDGYFTVKLKNSRIEPRANLLRPDSFSVIFHF